MYLLTVDRLCQAWEYDRDDKMERGTEWKHSVNVVPFMKKEDAVKYLSALKEEYHAKGNIADGKIIGQKITKEENEFVVMRWVEEVFTDISEAEIGKEFSVSVSSDVGEY